MDDNELSDRMMNLLEDVSGDPSVRDHMDDDLFELGFLDSMAAIELLVGIEDEFGVNIAPTEVERSAMNTPAKIIAQVQKRL